MLKTPIRLLRRNEAIAALGAGMVTFAPGRHVQAADPATVRVATAPNDGASVPFYAEEQGFFREAGIEAQIQTFNSGAAIVSAVLSGDYDLGYANILSLAQAHERDLPVTIVFPASSYNGRAPATVLVVPLDSPIRDAKDLSTKTLAIPGIGTLLQLAPMAWVDAHGGDARSIKFVEVAPPLIVGAVEGHRVDVGMISEPFLALSAGKVRVLAPGLDGIASTFISGGWFVNKAWGSAHPALVTNLTRVLARGARWANAHTHESSTILAKVLKIDSDVASRMVRTPYPERMQLDSLQRQIDLAVRYHFLREGFPAADLLN